MQRDVALRRLRFDVAHHRPCDDRERRSLSAFIAAFDQLDDPFSQATDVTHVTGSAIVVGPHGVVLLKHKRLGIWVQPGGHIDPGETPWDAARREAEEETGLAVDFVGPLDDQGVPPLVHVDVHAGGRGHTHLDVRYLFDGGSTSPAPPADESQEVGWFEWSEAIERADPGLAGVLAHLARSRYRP